MEKVVLKGCCDIDALNVYLDDKNKIFEGSFLDKHQNRIWIGGHSLILEMLLQGRREPELDDHFFLTSIFCKDTKYIVLSTLQEVGTGVYVRKKDGVLIPYGDSKEDKTMCQKSILSPIDGNSDEYSFLGSNDFEHSISIYKKVVDALSDKLFVFLLGPEKEWEAKEMSPVFANSSSEFIVNNHNLISTFANNPRVFFVNPNAYLSKSFIDNNRFYYHNFSIVHYKRKVYYLLAKDIQMITDSCIKATLKNEIKRDFKRAYRRFVLYFRK